MVLLGALCVVLVADLYVSDERRVVTYWLSMVALVSTLVAILIAQPLSRDFDVSHVRRYPSHFDLGNLIMRLKLIAQLFRQFS